MAWTCVKVATLGILLLLGTHRLAEGFSFTPTTTFHCPALYHSLKPCRIRNSFFKRKWLREQSLLSAAASERGGNVRNTIIEEETTAAPTPLQHQDITWKLVPSPETPWLDRIGIRISANLLRWDCQRQGVEPPAVLCPQTPNQQVVLEAYLDGSQKVGRFGITTIPGPPIPPLQETVQELFYKNNQALTTTAGAAVRSAAIIYMFVEPPFRKRDIGRLALQVIAFIHAFQGCDFTVLVADDDGSGKLIEWYERHGFYRAPKLQQAFGSPDGIYGTSMLAPTNGTLPEGCKIQWW